MGVHRAAPTLDPVDRLVGTRGIELEQHSPVDAVEDVETSVEAGRHEGAVYYQRRGRKTIPTVAATHALLAITRAVRAQSVLPEWGARRDVERVYARNAVVPGARVADRQEDTFPIDRDSPVVASERATMRSATTAMLGVRADSLGSGSRSNVLS